MRYLFILFSIFASFLAAETLPGFYRDSLSGEQKKYFTWSNDVEIYINAPEADSLCRDKETLVIFYACPAGNTIVQTAGKKLSEGDDWHYDIQHIAAQTRFLRNTMQDRNIITVYLQDHSRSWSLYDERHPRDHSKRIRNMIRDSLKPFADFNYRIILSGHSAGGSWILGYLSGIRRIPERVQRIVFLDSNYNYKFDADHYDRLLKKLLKRQRPGFLCVFAYNDSIALYGGKPVVSPEGGTWWNTRFMKKRLGEWMNFTEEKRESLTAYRALNGRVQIWLKENPGREILHTTQVYRNGFIHGILSGTEYDEAAYRYYGPPAYMEYIYPGE